MRTRICVGLLLLSFFCLIKPLTTCAQNTEQRPEGWQGPWPGEQQDRESAPQKDLPPPGPQRSTPEGKQVLEIPSHPQNPTEPSHPQTSNPLQPQQETPRPDQLITVTVTDPQGRYVADLQQEDFVLYEDDVPQSITYFNTGEKEPISLGILVDVSGSMRKKIDRAGFALRYLITTIRTGDEIFIEAFAGQPVVLQDFTDSRPVLLATLPALPQELRRQGGLCSLENAERMPETHCGTSLYTAILDGLRRLRRGGRQKKALVVISDGMDTRSSNSLEETIQTAQRSGALIYAIGIGRVDQSASFLGGLSDDALDIPTLTRASEATGGRLFTMTTEDALSNTDALNVATQTISRELRSQYSLGYAPLKPGSQYRNLRVEARSKDNTPLTVRSPQGYAADSRATDSYTEEPKPRKIFRN
jgi:Ca-activated chloride channel family protein